MTVAVNDVLVGGQFLKTHWTSCVELLGGDAHFAAQAKFTAVGEPGGGIDINGGAVDHGGESGDIRVIEAQYAVAVAGEVILSTEIVVRCS